MKITEFDIKISTEAVCAMIDADKSGDLYEEVQDELEEMLPEAYKKIEPVAILEFGELDASLTDIAEEKATDALYGILSVGGELSQWSTQLFAQGDYLGGMLADAIADYYLFQMDQMLKQRVLQMCAENGKGIVRRLEAPQDVPMSIQKVAFDVTHAAEEIGLKIKESYMYDPVKSICQVYVLDDNIEHQNYEHDCSNCDNYRCRMRKIPVTLKLGQEEKVVIVPQGKSLLEALREEGIFISAVCAGRGTCGKCRVQVLRGEIAATDADKKVFSEEELEQGYRLACKLYPVKPCEVLIGKEREEDFFVLAQEKEEADISENAKYGIAADIGTTTIAMQLVDFETGKVADVYTSINKQRAYGADVLSRIEASNRGQKEELRKSIRSDLLEGIRYFMENRSLKVKDMRIAANTTMVHLLMGYSCETLGVFPFTPVNIKTIHTTYRELFEQEEYDFDITICPGISTYVGGDITAGMYALGFEKMDKISVLIDLGTNGEMAVGNKDRIMVTSTAAGPAFEGGNIVCGTGSIPGAVCKVELQGTEVKLKTIGDKKPVGICGTGVIDTVYELKEAEVIDETGYMEEPYFEEGYLLDEQENIRFYQNDVREIQLAKSAVRAGLETLLLQYGVSYEDIDKIYIAGGFGYQMDVHKAVGIGLLPEACEEKIAAVGNTSLGGTVKSLTEEKSIEAMELLVKRSEEISLSQDKNFQDLYMKYICFEE